MKKIAIVCLALLVPALFFAQAKKPNTEVTVFAAASMTEAMNEIKVLYEKKNPNVKIIYNFDSSGTLKTQIQNGAPCDIFISAGQLQMNQLDSAADPAVNVQKLDFVLSGSRFNIVTNKVVLIVPQNSKKGITDFKDITTSKVSLVALGNSDVPVGQYSREIYTNLGLWDTIQASGKVTWGSNVKEVVTQVAEGAVDCGIVYSTDAASAKGVKVAAAAPAGSHGPIVYPAAVLKNVKDPKAAIDFAEYLKGTEATKVFAKIGFARP